MGEQPTRPAIRTDVLVVALLLVFLFFFLAGTALLLRFAHTAARDAAMNSAISASEVVNANAEWVIESASQVLSRVDDNSGPELQSLPANAVERIRQSIATMPGNPKVYLVSADGGTRFTTDPDFKPIDIRDREYFKAVAGGQPVFVSQLLVSRLNNEQIFAISKRVERNGQFAGAAIISFNSSLIEGVWNDLRLGPGSAVSIVRDDAHIVTRFPLPPGPQNISDSPLFTTHLPKASEGFYDAVSVTDGVKRLIAYKRVPGSNLIALASLGQETAFAAYRNFVNYTLLLVTPISFLLSGLALYSYRRLAADEQRHKELAQALESNRMLLREIHHRVKNNLQAVLSLVRLQKIPPEAKQAMQDRLLAMVAVHEQLYSRDQFATVDASQYIRRIADKVAEGYGRSITMRYALDPLEIDREQAMPLGLITNEVVSNAAKYAFPKGKGGEIRVELKDAGDGRALFRVIDNGVGYEAREPSTGMGSRLIEGFSVQMQGQMSYRKDSGTTFELVFPFQAHHRA
jgi:two-component sensor histidine kinase